MILKDIAFDNNATRSWHPLANGHAPDWASGWGQDRKGVWLQFSVANVVQKMRWIPPGSFMMGSTDETDIEHFADEQQHQVTLTQGYWLADSACTQALWLAVMGENPSRFQENTNNPVENISWDDAQQFIQQLNHEFPGLWARLPTEAEWEYACRAGTTTPFSFGDNITTEQVNYNGNYPYVDAAKGEDRGKTLAVKSLPANPWGLYEMHGNVWEWCSDCYGEFEQAAMVKPPGPPEGALRMLRGGSWYDGAGTTRSAYRRLIPANSYHYSGFRLALGQEQAYPR